MRAVGLAALVFFVGTFMAEAGQPRPQDAEPPLRITDVVTQVEISKWVEEPGMAPSVFFTLHTEAGDISDAAPYGKGMVAHCFVGDRATVEGYFPPDWPHEIRYFWVVPIEPCDHDTLRNDHSQPDETPSRP
jgi:hypothetical protein